MNLFPLMPPSALSFSVHPERDDFRMEGSGISLEHSA